MTGTFLVFFFVVFNTGAHTHAHAHTRTYAHTHTHAHMHAHTRTHTHTHTHTYAHTHAHTVGLWMVKYSWRFAEPRGLWDLSPCSSTPRPAVSLSDSNDWNTAARTSCWHYLGRGRRVILSFITPASSVSTRRHIQGGWGGGGGGGGSGGGAGVGTGGSRS